MIRPPRNLYIERRSRMDFKGNKKVGGKRTINKKFGPSGKRTKKKKKITGFVVNNLYRKQIFHSTQGSN